MPKPAKKQRQRKLQQERAVRLAAERKTRNTRIIAGLLVLALVAIAAVSFTAFESKDSACPKPDGSSSRKLDFTEQPPMCIDKEKEYSAVFDTSEGTFTVALDTKRTPETANNFVVLSRYHYYDNTKIFRTNTGIDIFQSGSPHTQDNSDNGPGYKLKDEGSPFKYEKGDIAMASSSAGNSAGQYFIGAGPQISQLDQNGTYLKFGKITDGMPVAEAILKLHKSSGQSPDEGAPSKDVTVKSIRIVES